MFELLWILQDGQPVPCPNPRTWAQWMIVADSKQARRVARTDVANAYVSTVFLGVAQGSRRGVALLYETMVFGIDAFYQAKYTTRALALEGHDRAVAWLERKMGRSPSARP